MISTLPPAHMHHQPTTRRTWTRSGIGMHRQMFQSYAARFAQNKQRQNPLKSDCGQWRDGQRRLDGTPSPASVAVCGATAVRRTPVSLPTFVTCKPAQTDAASHQAMPHMSRRPHSHACMHGCMVSESLAHFLLFPTLRPRMHCTDSCCFSTALSRQFFASQHSVLLFGMRTVTSKIKAACQCLLFNSPIWKKKKLLEPVRKLMPVGNHCVHVRAACVTSMPACHKQQ